MGKKATQATKKMLAKDKKNVKIRRILYVFMLLLVLGFALWGWVGLSNPKNFPIKTVKIAGSFQHLNEQDLKKIILPYVEAGFFDLDIDSLKTKLLSIPWVSKVSISRTWPSTVTIRINERRAIAVWNNEELITKQGDLFTPDKATFPKDIPLFLGPEGQQQQVLSNYLLMNDMLSALGVKINILSLSERQAWKIELSNGTWLYLGNDNIFMRLERYIAVYANLFKAKQPAVYVDLRYTNGMAVKW